MWPLSDPDFYKSLLVVAFFLGAGYGWYRIIKDDLEKG